MLARTGRLSADIEDLTAVIERLLAPYEEQLQQATSRCPAGDAAPPRNAVAETGVDMTRFRTGPHLVSWAAAPRKTTSGSARDAPRPKRATGTSAILGETPVAAGRTQTREGVRHRRLAQTRHGQGLRRHREHPAEGLPQLLADPGMRYADLGPDYYDRQRDTRRQIAHHVGELESLGFEVTLCRIPDADPDGTGPSPRPHRPRRP